MRAPIGIFLPPRPAGCCAGGYDPVTGARPGPFDAFQASMKLAVGMPTMLPFSLSARLRSPPKRRAAESLAGYEWPCQLLKFGCCENNQLLVYVAPTPDGRGAVNSWAVRKG